MFHLHQNNAHTDHLRSCFPCHASTLQIIFETSKVVFQISCSIHCLISISLGFLIWYISIQRSWIIPFTAGTGQLLSTCLCIVTLLCQKLDPFFHGLFYITALQLVPFITVNAYIWILVISSYKC